MWVPTVPVQCVLPRGANFFAGPDLAFRVSIRYAYNILAPFGPHKLFKSDCHRFRKKTAHSGSIKYGVGIIRPMGRIVLGFFAPWTIGPKVDSP